MFTAKSKCEKAINSPRNALSLLMLIFLQEKKYVHRDICSWTYFVFFLSYALVYPMKNKKSKQTEVRRGFFTFRRYSVECADENTSIRCIQWQTGKKEEETFHFTSNNFL